MTPVTITLNWRQVHHLTLAGWRIYWKLGYLGYLDAVWTLAQTIPYSTYLNLNKLTTRWNILFEPVVGVLLYQLYVGILSYDTSDNESDMSNIVIYTLDLDPLTLDVPLANRIRVVAGYAQPPVLGGSLITSTGDTIITDGGDTIVIDA